MAKYDGLIIPRSYSDYLNKADGATLSQMLDSIGGTFDASPTPNSVKPARSGGIFAANAVITSDNATLSGVTISERSVVRVMFTADLTGSDETTGLTLTYNGNTYAVKVGKDGALEALTAHLIEESYIYLQAYTTLELAFDGSQFVVMGNPVVISNADLSIMADGLKTYTIKEKIFLNNANHAVEIGIDSNNVLALIPMGENDVGFTNDYTIWFYSDYNASTNSFSSTLVCTNAFKFKVIYQNK